MSMTPTQALPGDGTAVQWGEQTYIIGQAMMGEDLDAVPIGTTVWDSGRRDLPYYTKIAMLPHRRNGWRRSDRDDLGGLTPRLNTLRHMPVMTAETAAEFKQRFAGAVLEAAEEFSTTHQRLARQVLDGLGATGATRVGPPPTDPPIGTVVTHGSPDQKEFTVFRFGRQGWKKMAGYYDRIEDANIITALPQDPGPDSETEIAEFKQAVWEAGQKVKQDHKWCSKYDEILASFDIVDPAGMPDFSNWPTLVKGEDARDALEEDSVLGVARGDWGIFHKRDGVWVRVCGTRPLAAGTMHLLSSGPRMRISVTNPLLDFLPTGTVIEGRRANRYTKNQDGGWVGRRETYPSTQFTLPVDVIAFP